MFHRRPLFLAVALVGFLVVGTVGTVSPSVPRSRPEPADLAAAHAPAATPDRVSWLGGRWFALGYNFPWHSYNYDFGDDSSSNVRGSYQKLEGQFAELRDYGTHVTRWYVFNDAARYPLFDGQGRVTGLPASFFDNFDAALSLASTYNIYLIPVLVDALIADKNRDARTGRSAVITDPAVRHSYLEHALKPVLQRYGGHPNILAWSVMNEPDWAAGFTNDPNYIRIPVPVLRDFIQQSAHYVHTYATQGTALDLGGLPWLDEWRDLGIDVYLAHWYPWIDRYYGADKSPYNRTADSFNIDKPIIIAEFPIQNTPYSVQQSLDTFYRNGYAGALAWCFPNNTDEWCDRNSYYNTRDALHTWAHAHEAEVNIRPVPGLSWRPERGPRL